MTYEFLLTAEHGGSALRVGVITLNRPKQLSALNDALSAICSLSLPSIMVAKACVGRAFESPLAEGILYERRLFHALFATEDQSEGMDAFLNKRPAVFQHR